MLVHKIKQSRLKKEYTESMLCNESIRLDVHKENDTWNISTPYSEMASNNELQYPWRNVTCPLCLAKKRGVRVKSYRDKERTMRHYYYLNQKEAVIRIYSRRKPGLSHAPFRGVWAAQEYSQTNNSWIIIPGMPELSLREINTFTYIGSLKRSKD